MSLSTRRRFVQKLTAATFALGSGTATYSAGWERRRPVLVENILPCPHLRESQHGIKVLHLSDLHADDWTPTVAIERAVRLANEAHPDLIVFTGDYITSKPDLFLSAARALAGLHAPLGLFAMSWIRQPADRELSPCRTTAQADVSLAGSASSH